MAVQSSWYKNLDGSPFDSAVCPNSVRIVFPAGATIVDLLDTIGDAITSRGWELWDAGASGNASYPNGKAYRAPNLDGSYKYVVVYNYQQVGNAGYIGHNACEYWDAATHGITNPVYIQTYTNDYQPYDLSLGGSMVVFASPRYLCIYGQKNSTWGGGMGCNVLTEITREVAADPKLWPTFGAANISSIYPGSSGTMGILYVPRTGDNQTNNNATVRLLGPYGSMNCLNSSGSSAPTNVQVDYYTTRPVAFSFSSIRIGTSISYTHGRICGVKALAVGVGSALDEVVLRVDGNGFADPNGTPQTHVVLAYSTTARLALPK